MKLKPANLKYLFLFGFVAVLTFLSLRIPVKSNAASLASFDPGNIISDYTMSNVNTMSVADIDRFLHDHGNCNNTSTYLANNYPNLSYHIENGHFVCLADERFGEGTTIGSGQTAAEIIYEVAHEYSINPQVLIVLLQKEQGLVTDSWPNNIQYRSATGYGCPDTAACDSKYYGFKNQLKNAANLFRTVLNGGWTNYPLGVNYIYYNPDRNCGGSNVEIKNLATSSLYRYTPYQPNSGALAAGYGTAACGAYGNRNFYLYFVDYFNYDPATGEENANLLEVIRQSITENKLNVGSVTGVIKQIGASENYYKTYTNGIIYLHSTHGVKFIQFGPILDTFRAHGLESGKMGYPTSNLLCTLKNNNCYQLFENAVLYYNTSTKISAAVLSGDIRNLYRSTGLENGVLGLPISNQTDGLPGNASYQLFENGVVYSIPKLGTFYIKSGEVRNIYRRVGLENSPLGYPISNEQNGTQSFENGVISNGTAFSTKIYEAYSANKTLYGSPITDVSCGLKNNGCYQIFTTGIAYQSSAGVYLVRNGSILDQFRTKNREAGIGYPISNEQNGTQSFENGVISK